MCQYSKDTLQPKPLDLPTGAKEHILVVQDESIFHVNDRACSVYLAEGQNVLRQKGNGHAIHVSDFLDEKSLSGQLSLTHAQLKAHENLAPECKLKVTDARKIIYPGKNSDGWWDMRQLLEQMESAIDIFEYIHPSAVGVFAFDCSSAHKALSEDALNVNNMNIKPGRKKACLRNTVIPEDIPAPQHAGIADMRGVPQKMCFSDDHPDPNLCGLPKGMMQVLKERESVWEILSDGGCRKPVGICKRCQLSQKKRDALAWAELLESSGQDHQADNEESEVPEDSGAMADKVVKLDHWCCMKHVLALQSDFAQEKPYLQKRIEERGHKCIFLLKFHCELNAIEMYWGFAKSSEIISLSDMNLNLISYEIQGIEI